MNLSIIFCRLFGVKDGPFDFSQYKMAEIQRTLRNLEQKRDALRKTINFNVMDMIDRVEAKDVSLRQMLSTVKKDRSKIEETIGKLNDFMLDALNKTWTKVNRYIDCTLILRLTLVIIVTLVKLLKRFCQVALPS